MSGNKTVKLGTMENLDAWENATTSMGVTGKDPTKEAKFKRTTETQQDEYRSLYAEDWLFARSIDAVAEHGTQKWIRIKAKNEAGTVVKPSFGSSVLMALQNLNAREAFEDAWKLDRLEGGAYILIGANGNEDPDSYREELTPENTKSIDFLNVLSYRDLEPALLEENTGTRTNQRGIQLDPTKPNYMMPEAYKLTAVAGERRTIIHNSRVIRFTGLRRPLGAEEYQERGMSITDRIYDTMQLYGTAVGNFGAMFRLMSQTILTIKDYASMMAADKNDEGAGLILKRLQAFAMQLGAFNMAVLDETETIDVRTIDFTNASVALLRMFDLVSGAAETPLSILFGQAPSGLSTDDEGGRKSFFSMVARLQSGKLRRGLTHLVGLLMSTEAVQTDDKEDIAQWSVEFVPLDEPSKLEAATIEKTESETDAARVREGIITDLEARTRLSKDPNSPYDLDETFESFDKTPEVEDDDDVVDDTKEDEPEDKTVIEGDKPGIAGDVQTSVLNGAQVSSMVDVIKQAVEKSISRESAKAILIAAFGFDDTTAESMLGPQDFEPKEKAIPAAFGGVKNGDPSKNEDGKDKPGSPKPPFEKQAE